MGIIHRNLSIEDQAAEVDRVKRSESGMISDPVTISPDATLAELDELCATYRVSGLPVVDEQMTVEGQAHAPAPNETIQDNDLLRETAETWDNSDLDRAP